MKKILMLILGIICLFIVPEVKAQTYRLNLLEQKGIYFRRTGGTLPDKSGPFSIYMVGNNIAYCIEPSKNIKTFDYVTADGFVDLPYSNELKEKLELYGYYGREYPGHDNVRYSMAAQSLIWNATSGQTVTFWTSQEGGSQIDVSKEINEILKLVEKHRRLPNLPSNIYADTMHEYVLEDSNKALDNFEVISGGPYEAYIENNKLHVMPHDVGVFSIHLQRKKYDSLNTLIFVGNGTSESQTLGRLRFSNLSEQEITLSTEGVHIFLHKKDRYNNPLKMSGIRFKVKNLSTGEYLCDFQNCEYETDQEGIFVTNGVDFGEYEIEEVEDQIIKGYSWNREKKRVNVSEELVKWDNDKATYIDVDFTNFNVITSLELTKKGEVANFNNNEVTYQEINLGNVYFDLYDENNHFIETLVTNQNGYVKSSTLTVGKYYLIEKTNLDGYVPNPNKINFEIKQTSSHQIEINYRMTVKNLLKKGTLDFQKIDFATSKGIPNTIIEIYNEQSELLFTKETDNNGKVVIPNLPVGKYYILEKEANYYYQKSNEKVPFEIKENGEIVKASMTNKKIVGNLFLTKYGESFMVKNNEISYEMKKLPDIEFYLYDENNKLIDTLKVDNNGFIKKELELGKYYLIEKTKLTEYKENNEKYFFEIKKNGNVGADVKININNYLKKGGVEFSKEELLTQFGISDTIMEIYNDKNELLFTRKTDNDGKIIINSLPLGKYYFHEKEANYFFQITDEKVPFEIKKDGEVVKTYLTNEKIVGNLEIYKKGENYHYIENNIIYEKINLHHIEFDLYDENNQLIDHIVTDKNGYAKYNNLPLGKYYLIEKTNLDNYIHDGKKYSFEIKKNGNIGLDVKLDIDNYLKKGNLEFSKIDFTNSMGIPNTIIEIYDNNSHLLFTKKTDKDGKVSINNLPVGKYYIIEKEANYYYQKSNEKVLFEIKENGEIVKAKMANKKIVGNLEIIKSGEEYHSLENKIVYKRNKLAGIIFALYDENNQLIDTLKTDKNGYIKYENLPLGKYYVIEKNDLNNYITKNEKIFFEIKKDGSKGIDVKLNIDNYLKKGNLEFSKTDLVTSEGIPNTIIEIYNSNDELLLTKETDKNGKVSINNLPVGKYYILEKEANYYYHKSNEKVPFEIKENGEIVKAKMTNKKIVGNLEILKKGEDYKYIDNEIQYEKTELGNIEFSLYDTNDQLINTLKTNDDGYVKFTNLSLGKYYVIENNNNSKYVFNKDRVYFEIKKGDDIAIDVKLNIDNYLKKGVLDFSKEDLVTSEGIPNTIIEIYDENNNLILTKETDENGKIIINNLPIGRYYIIEKEANSLYQITNEKVIFEIKENGDVIKAKMTNEKIVIPVPKTNTKESVIAHTLFGICFLVGIGRFYYERKETT